MIEPDTPTTIWIKHPVYPAFLLANDEGKPLKPSSVILRHRHLRHQQRIIQSGVPPSDSPGGKLVRRTVLSVPTSEEELGGSTRSSTTDPISPPSLPASPETIASSPSTVPNETRQSAEESGLSVAGAASSTADIHRPAAGPSSTRRPATVADTTPLNLVMTKTVDTSIGPLVVTHQERALRARGNKPHIRHEKTAWYFSSCSRFMDVPPTLPGVALGELYVHEGPDKQKQVWMWTTESSWESLQVADPHPYLPNYILNFCSNGEPSWVTRETLRTYMGRMRKREVDQQATHQSPSQPL